MSHVESDFAEDLIFSGRIWRSIIYTMPFITLCTRTAPSIVTHISTMDDQMPHLLGI